MKKPSQLLIAKIDKLHTHGPGQCHVYCHNQFKNIIFVMKEWELKSIVLQRAFDLRSENRGVGSRAETKLALGNHLTLVFDSQF